MQYYSLPRIWLRNMRGIVYPRRCPFCGRVLGSVFACEECAPERESLRRKPVMRLNGEQHYLHHVVGAAAPFEYKKCVRRAILRAKYEGEPWVAVELGTSLAQLAFGSEVQMVGSQPVPQPVAGVSLGYDCIVPVPASGRQRGYNVPELMARPLAQALQLPLEAQLLTSPGKKRHQAGLPLDERLLNVAGAFRVQKPEDVEGKRVLLVDDVITTGATATACAQALMAAGAESVFALALATVEFEHSPAGKQPIWEDEEG